MAFQGQVKSFSDLKGWGFVIHDGMDVFMHVRECKDGRPAAGDIITFDVEEDPVKKGQMRAVNISGCSQPLEGPKGKGKGKGNGAHQGQVKSFNDLKGWGFITYNGADLFLHVKECLGFRPVAGDWVAFDLEEDTLKGGGQMKATRITGGSGWPLDGDKGWGKGKGGYGPAWDPGYGGWGGKDPYGKGGCGYKGGWDDWDKGGYGYKGDFGKGKGGFGYKGKDDFGCKGKGKW